MKNLRLISDLHRPQTIVNAVFAGFTPLLLRYSFATHLLKIGNRFKIYWRAFRIWRFKDTRALYTNFCSRNWKNKKPFRWFLQNQKFNNTCWFGKYCWTETKI